MPNPAAFLRHLDGNIVAALDTEIAAHTSWIMTVRKGGFATGGLRELVDQIAGRWQIALDGAETPDSYRQQTRLALALLLHKYGWQDARLTKQALAALPMLAPQLPEAFERVVARIEDHLRSPTVAPQRRPARIKHAPQFRPGDLLAVRHAGKVYCAFIHEIERDGSGNQYPIIEFFSRVFDRVPSADELKGVTAQGHRYDDGVWRADRYAIIGLDRNPDPAGQIEVLTTNLACAPDGSRLGASVGLYAIRHLFRLPEIIADLPFGRGPRS